MPLRNSAIGCTSCTRSWLCIPRIGIAAKATPIPSIPEMIETQNIDTVSRRVSIPYRRRNRPNADISDSFGGHLFGGPTVDTVTRPHYICIIIFCPSI